MAKRPTRLRFTEDDLADSHVRKAADRADKAVDKAEKAADKLASKKAKPKLKLETDTAGSRKAKLRFEKAEFTEIERPSVAKHMASRGAAVTLTSKAHIIIDRDNKGEETVHFLNQVDEADLLKLMDEEEVAEVTKPVEETKPEVVETVPEITEPAPEEKPKSKNMLPAILTLIVLACGGGFFVFKKVQEKKKEQEAAKPDPDADYVDDDEDYGYDPEFEDDDADSSVDEDDNEPV